MDEHNDLPDDLNQWPESDWDLFDLDSQTVSYNDLRKAYSKLIKRFRPETHPDHFQRIQEAFETLRELILSDKTAPQDRQEPTSDSKNNQHTQQRRSKRQKEFLNTLYSQYIYKADWDGAKRFLESAIEPENPSQEKQEEIADLGEIPYLYMFWLLYTINPLEEDNFPDIFKYLLQGENSAKEEESLSVSIKTFFFFLERQKLSHKSSVYDYALNHLDFPAILLLLNARWVNLRFEEDADDVDIILADLKNIKKRFVSNLKEWARINIEAIEHLLWINNIKAKKAVDECMESIAQYPDYRSDFDDKLDYLDRVEQTIASLRSIPKILPVDTDAIHTILYMTGNAVFSRYRRSILKLVSDLADDVLRAFLVFDYLNLHHPLVAIRLCDAMQELYLTRHENEDELSEEQAENVVNRIRQIIKLHNYDYSSCRLPLLKFLLEEQLPLIKVSQIVSNGLENILEDASEEQNADKLKKWRSDFISDGSVVLTYYAIMCCEIDKMEDYDN